MVAFEEAEPEDWSACPLSGMLIFVHLIRIRANLRAHETVLKIFIVGEAHRFQSANVSKKRLV